MNTDQLMRIAVAFARSTLRPDGRICVACRDVLEVSGTGITVLGGDRSAQLCVSDDRTGLLEDIQFTVGQGPRHDAFASRLPVGLQRMDAESSRRWPAFVDLAITSGVGAVFAYPLTIHGSTIGVLTLYQDAAGQLSATQHDDSLTISEVLAEAVLGLQDTMPDSELAPGLDDEAMSRAQTHQAAGMVSVQLSISLTDALVVLRSHAFAHGLRVDAVASEVVARRLRFDDNSQAGPPEGTRGP